MDDVRAPDDSGRQKTIAAALEIAADEVAAHGWDGLQVNVVAARLGVSRQTIYNAFTNKHGLAQALLLQLTQRFLDGVQDALAGGEDPYQQWRAAIVYTLDAAAADPLLKSILTADGHGELLPLLTRDAGPIITAVRDPLAAVVLRGRPDLDPTEARAAAETATRLAISHIVLPLHPTSDVATHIATLISRYIDSPTGPTR